MSMERLTELFERGQSVSDSALRTSSYAEDYRVRGYKFVHFNPDVLASGTSYFVLDATAIDSAAKGVFTIPMELDVPEGPITITLYEDTDYSGTVDMPFYNPNRIDGATAEATIKGSATGTDKGTELYKFIVGSAATAAVKTTQGTSQSTDPTVIDSTKKYLVQVDNSTGGAVTANSVYFAWFEVPVADL